MTIQCFVCDALVSNNNGKEVDLSGADGCGVQLAWVEDPTRKAVTHVAVVCNKHIYQYESIQRSEQKKDLFLRDVHVNRFCKRESALREVHRLVHLYEWSSEQLRFLIDVTCELSKTSVHE